jgi:hypothetical protein
MPSSRLDKCHAQGLAGPPPKNRQPLGMALIKAQCMIYWLLDLFGQTAFTNCATVAMLLSNKGTRLTELLAPVVEPGKQSA